MTCCIVDTSNGCLLFFYSTVPLNVPMYTFYSSVRLNVIISKLMLHVLFIL